MTNTNSTTNNTPNNNTPQAIETTYRLTHEPTIEHGADTYETVTLNENGEIVTAEYSDYGNNIYRQSGRPGYDDTYIMSVLMSVYIKTGMEPAGFDCETIETGGEPTSGYYCN